jgi:uncharacterized UPF0160 family protein
MNLEYLRKFIKEKKEQYPSLTSKINDWYYLCLSEIDEGGSEQGEVDSCISTIEEIIEEFIEENKNN